MTHEKPDMLSQSVGFEEVHSSLKVALITTGRRDGKGHTGVRVCRPHESLAQVRGANVDPVFDYLPVEAIDGDIVGMFSAKSSLPAGEVDNEDLVRDHMCPLSEADLIGADATILDFIRRVRQEPLLVVSGGRIKGLIAWSDLQKLPVRAAIFALVTGFELTMYEAIRALCSENDGWYKHLSPKRLERTKKVFAQRDGNNSDVELLLCTEFCDKRTILKKSLQFASQPNEARVMPMSKGTFDEEVKRIEALRNPVAHASTYAMNWEEVESLRKTVQTVEKLRNCIKEYVRHVAISPDIS